MPTQSVIGAQMYTLREFTKTPADIAATMKKVRAIGYKAVQLSALGPIEVGELKKILDGEGLTVSSTHLGLERARDHTQEVIDEYRLLDCKYTAVASMPAEYRNAEGYHKFAREATEVGRRLAEGGVQLTYHNHSFELEKYDGKTGLEIIYSESDPKYLQSEIDTYWIQHGGGDSAEWIRRLAGRAPLLHLKDMGVIDGKQAMTEVGEGNLNWPAIMDAARASGVVWYLVEQDVCMRDPFESLAISLRNLKAMGLH